MSTPRNALEERYGVRRFSRNTKKWAIIASIAGGVVVIVGWMVWTGFAVVTPVIDARELGHRIIDEHWAEISFEVSAPPGTEGSCALEAVDQSFTVVGWKTITIPASDVRTRSFTEAIRTIQPSTNALIYRCWAR